MSLNIVQNLTKYNYSDGSRGKGDIKYIVIHYFGSLGTAKSVANYFASAYRGASAHYSIDEGENIYQSVLEEDIAWHCGANSYIHANCRNRNSIGIEVRPYKLDPSTASSASVRDWYFTPEIVDNLVAFTKSLMKKCDIPPENVVRHYDVTGKWCPRPYMGDDTNEYYGTSGNNQWAIFKARISQNEEDLDMTKDELISCAGTGDAPSNWAIEATDYCKKKGIFNGDGAGNFGWQQPITREAVAQIIYNAFERAGVLDNIPDK